jgi:hypothetical protein
LDGVIVGVALIQESALMGRFQTWIKQKMTKADVLEEMHKILSV